ncbi:hypothetical protein, partial [Haloferax sp. ATB1]|uniref:hypothetical protein n=1 Tax=Haloferax sp. ATB1 TaxID=1508454 RepID=UPI0005B1D293
METVDLPANGEIKQLAHDVVREDNEYAVPLLLDFYEFLSKLDEDDHSSLNDLTPENSRSEVAPTAWRNFLETLEDQDVVEKHLAVPTPITLKKWRNFLETLEDQDVVEKHLAVPTPITLKNRIQ